MTAETAKTSVPTSDTIVLTDTGKSASFRFIENNSRLEYFGMDSKIFEKNLQMVDSMMPYILSRLLQISYSENISKISEVVGILEEEDPLETEMKGFYDYKVGTVLGHIALGLGPHHLWNGEENLEDQVSQKYRELCGFDIGYQRREFEKYLLNHTTFQNICIQSDSDSPGKTMSADIVLLTSAVDENGDCH